MPYDPFARVRDRSDRCRGHPTRVRLRVDRRAVPRRRRRRRRSRPSITHGPWASATSMSPRSTATGPASGGSVRRCRIGRATSTSCRPRSDASSATGDRSPGADIDHQALDGRDDAYYADVGDRRGHLRLLGRGREPFARGKPGAARSGPRRPRLHPRSRRPLAGRHRGAYPALASAARAGRRPCDRVGMNQSPMLVRFARETEMDAFLVAGRYTLLDQDALGRSCRCASSEASRCSSAG